MDCIVKREFVRKLLKDEANRFNKNQSLRITQRLKFHTGNLQNNRKFKIEAPDSMDGKLSLTHPSYERFLDMRTVKSRTYTAVNRKGEKNQKRGYGLKRFKGYQIHNTFVWGHYNSIARRLAMDLTDDVIQSINNDLNSDLRWRKRK